MNQTLFDQPLAHTNDAITSYKAADKMIESGKLNEQEAEVYDVLKRHDRDAGYTAKELAFLMEGVYETCYFKIQRRLSGLRRKGKVGRIRLDGKLDFSETPNRNEIMERNGCCVWKVAK